MEEREQYKVYTIPPNYTDSGKLLGGMVSARNAIETVILVGVLGALEWLIPMPTTFKIVVMAVSLLVLAVFTMVGVDGDSLCQYVGHIFKFLCKRRKLHFKRIDDDGE